MASPGVKGWWTTPRHQRDSPRKYGFAFVQFSIGLKAQGPPGCHVGPPEQRELGIASRLARNQLARSRKLGDDVGVDREASFPTLLFHAYEWQAIEIESAGRPFGPELDRRCATSKVEMLVATADQPLDLDVAAATLLDAQRVLIRIAKVLVDPCFGRAGRGPGCTSADKPIMEFLRGPVRPEPAYFGGQSHQAQNRGERSRSFQALGASRQAWAASASWRPML